MKYWPNLEIAYFEPGDRVVVTRSGLSWVGTVTDRNTAEAERDRVLLAVAIWREQGGAPWGVCAP